MVSFVLLLPVGIAADPADRPGLAAFTADMSTTRAAGASDSFAIHERLARIGGVFDTEVGADATMVSLTTLAKFARPALELLAEIMTAPRFDPEDVRRVRALRLSRLMQLRDVPSALAERVFASRLYGSHAYGHTAMGTEASLNAITVAELRAFHEECYRRSQPVLVASGDASHQELVDLVGETWRAPTGNHWKWGGAEGVPLAECETPAGEPAAAAGRRVADRHRGSAGRRAVGAARGARGRGAIDAGLSHAGRVEHGVGRRVRQPHQPEAARGEGLHLRRAFELRVPPSDWTVRGAGERADGRDGGVSGGRAARNGGDRRSAGQSQPSARRTQAALVRGFPRGFETAEQIARAMCQLALYDLPDDYFDRFVPRVKAVTG